VDDDLGLSRCFVGDRGYSVVPASLFLLTGLADHVLEALAERRFGDLARLAPAPQDEREQLAAELAAALARLRAVHACYWDHDWRREHRGFGRYPEHHLWEAVQGYLDLRGAASSAD
jgi:hypothetical protein